MSKEYILALDNYADRREYLVFSTSEHNLKMASVGGFIKSNKEPLAKYCRRFVESGTPIRLRPCTAQRVRITPTKTGFTFRLIGKPFDIE